MRLIVGQVTFEERLIGCRHRCHCPCHRHRRCRCHCLVPFRLLPFHCRYLHRHSVLRRRHRRRHRRQANAGKVLPCLQLHARRVSVLSRNHLVRLVEIVPCQRANATMKRSAIGREDDADRKLLSANTDRCDRNPYIAFCHTGCW